MKNLEKKYNKTAEHTNIFQTLTIHRIKIDSHPSFDETRQGRR